MLARNAHPGALYDEDQFGIVDLTLFDQQSASHAASADAAADDFGDTTSTAGTLAVGSTVTGTLEVPGDHDWFRVSLIAGHHYVLTEHGASSNGGTLPDTFMSLYNSAGVLLTSNDDGGLGFDSELAIAATTTGNYYISAQGFADVYTGTYTIGVQDLGSSSDRFSAPILALSDLGSSEGWTSQNTYPRQIANFNNDDSADIIVFGAVGTFVALGAGLHFESPTLIINNFGTAQGWSSQDTYPRLLADVNADGHQDIVGFGIAGTYVALGNGTSFGSPNLVLANFGANQGWNSENTYLRELGDVNGDGRADIVAFGIAGTYVSLANNSGGFTDPALVLSQFGTSQGWSSQDQYPRVLADVNGDQLADIVAFGQSGTYVSLATGGGNFAPATFEIQNFSFNANWTSNNSYPRLVADVNADGMADVVGFGLDGIYVSLATGGGHFASPIRTGSDMVPSTGWSSEDASPRLLGDVTGDGRFDIIGFGGPGTYISQSHHDWIVT